MTDTRALTEDEQRAFKVAFKEICPAAVYRRNSAQRSISEASFIAGLRYRDEAEPSEAEVEAAARAICDLSDDGEKWEDFLPESPVREDCRMEARAALTAARKASP